MDFHEITRKIIILQSMSLLTIPEISIVLSARHCCQPQPINVLIAIGNCVKAAAAAEKRVRRIFREKRRFCSVSRIYLICV